VGGADFASSWILVPTAVTSLPTFASNSYTLTTNSLQSHLVTRYIAADTATITGALSATGGISAGNSQVNHGYDLNTLAGNTSIALTNLNGGIIVVRNSTDGGSALILVDETGGSSVVSSTSAIFAVTDTGSSTSKICFISSPGSLIVYNRYATAKRILLSTYGGQGV
jgi:hypothetical protein